MAHFSTHFCALLVNSSQVEYMAQGIASCCELPTIHELEAKLRFGSFRSHVSDVLGGGGFLSLEKMVTR